MLHDAVADWNRLARQHDTLRRVQKLTDKRRRHLRARLRDCGGLEGWQGALAKIADSPFLLGRTGGPWSVTFDWLIGEANFVKLCEGNYDRTADPPSDGPADAFNQAFRSIASDLQKGKPL